MLDSEEQPETDQSAPENGHGEAHPDGHLLGSFAESPGPDRSPFHTARPELRHMLDTAGTCGLDLTLDEWLAIAMARYGQDEITQYTYEPVWIRCPGVLPNKIADSVRYATRGWFTRSAFRVAVRKPPPTETTHPDGSRTVEHPPGFYVWVQPVLDQLTSVGTVEDLVRDVNVLDVVNSFEIVDELPKRRTPWRKSAINSWVMATRAVPGMWIKYPEPVQRHVPSHIQKGTAYTALPGEFAVATRDDRSEDPKTVIMYVMYMGKMVPPSGPEVSARIDDLTFTSPPHICDTNMRRAKYHDYNCRPPIGVWIDTCVRPNPGLLLEYPGLLDMHNNVKSRIEDGRGFTARPGEFAVEVEELRDLYGAKAKRLRAKVSHGWRMMYPNYPDGTPPLEPTAEPDPVPDDYLATVAKKVRRVTLDDALQPGERRTADGTPAW